MASQISTLTRRFATILVAALLVVAAVAPAGAAPCCQTRSMMAFMHGTMPCCNHCKITGAQPSPDRDVATISSPAPTTPVVAVVGVAAPQTFALAAFTHDSAFGPAYSPPPQFLLNEQFRI